MTHPFPNIRNTNPQKVLSPSTSHRTQTYPVRFIIDKPSVVATMLPDILLESHGTPEGCWLGADSSYGISDTESETPQIHYADAVFLPSSEVIHLPGHGEGSIHCPLRPIANCGGWVRSATVPCDRCVV